MMSEAFDTGPLSWVKDEIDESLAQVKTHYQALADDLSKVDGLQMALSHLNQVQGALDMVGLAGCQRFCQEIITVTEQIKNNALTPNNDVVSTVILSVENLLDYLNTLMQGMPDVPMRLYPTLNQLAAQQNQQLEKSALFFPDTSFRPPSDLPSRQTPSTSLPLFIAEQRTHYQKALMAWLLNDEAGALTRMQNALVAVQTVQDKPLQISLWWAASTFITCLNQPAIVSEPGAKKLCRKLDQQLRDLATGEHKRSQALLTEILYYIALSEPDNESIKQVKTTFDLGALLNTDEQPLAATQQQDAQWLPLLAAYRKALPQLKNDWEQLTTLLWHVEASDVAIESSQLTPIVELSQSLLAQTNDYEALRKGDLKWDDVIHLSEVLHQVYAFLEDSIASFDERVALAIAGTLAMQERSINESTPYTDDQHQSASKQVSRLLQLLEDDSTAEAAVEATQPYEDDEVTRAVAQQVIESLVVVEKSVDSFFRAANETSSLQEALQQLKPVVAAFDMLEMSTPKTIAKLAVLYLEQFSLNAVPDATAHPNQSQFEVVAEAISLLGMFAHDLPEERNEVKQAMAASLLLLEQNMDDLVVDEADQVLYSESLDDDRRTSDRREQNRLADIQQAREADEIEITAVVDDADAEHTHQEVIEESPATFNLTPVVERAMDDELQSIFIAEAEELLEHNRLNLAALRANAEHEVALAEIRRAYHTLKGSGRTVGLEVLAEVAYSIEKLLNVLLEHKAEPSNEVIDFVSLCNQSFFDWIEMLKEAGQVTLNAGEYQQQAAEMTALLLESLQQKEPSPKKEEVLIGGSRKVGRAFFYLFLGEAQQHLNTLIAARRAIKEGSTNPPSASCRRAAHTLSSNALTAGFDAIGDLARALENWFDEFYGPWTDKHLSLFSKVINALKDGLEKAKNLQHPKSTRSLIIELSKTTAAMQVLATQQSTEAVVDNGLSDEERLGSSLSADEITVSRMSDEHEAADLPAPNVENEAQATMEVEALEGKEADRVRYSLSPPAFLPEGELADVVEAFEFEPQPSALEENVPSDDESDESFEQKVQDTLPVPPSIELRKTSEQIAKPSLVQPVVTQPSAVNKVVGDELAQLFVEEASELLPKIGQHLRQWKEQPTDDTLKAAVQRDLHTLKGSARTAGQFEIGDQAHGLEDRLDVWDGSHPTINDFDALFVDYDRISLLLEQLQASLSRFNVEEDQVLEADTQVETIPVEAEPTEQPSVGTNVIDANDSALTTSNLRVPASQLDALITQAGEVSILRSRLDREIHGLKSASSDLTLGVSRMRTYLKELELEADAQLQSRMTELKESQENFDPLELDRFTRLQELTRLMAEGLHDMTMIQQGMSSHIDQADVVLIQQNRMNREVQKGLMTVRMMPFSSIAERLHRIVRQISRELEKKVTLEIVGESIELDRSVLEQIGAPLEHLLRNAVVHGIETPQERLESGKPETGTIKLALKQKDEEIKLTIADDGRGIDLTKVQALAVEKGLLTEKQQISDEALIAVIFESGFTTKHAVTKNAGRGVGLDAVKSDIAALNGRIDLNNQPGQGVLFDIYLPVSLSATQVLVVKVNAQSFAIPAVMIEQVQTLKQQALEEAYEKQGIVWNANQYPLHCFGSLLGDHDYVTKNQVYTPMVFLRSGQHSIVLHVDEVVGNQEIVMKPMGTQLSKVPGIIGASVLGDGGIVYVMNPVQLAHREVITSGTTVKRTVPVEKVKKLALVVDDSLTMRKALSRILEKDGMAVVTANDGLDAVQKLNDLQPDVILTDIEMPRMDGFELAKHLRESDKTKSLPLVMISSRSANKHHEHAKEVGVNAFLGKPVQDDVLLQAVHTLVPS